MEYHIHIFLLKDNNQNHIINLYKQFQEDCIQQLSGEESFVLYNDKTQSYFAVRDIIGLRPLYYTFVGKQFYFSNNIETLFRKSGISKKPNLKTMQNIVYHSTIAYDETMYQDIKRLPPGHYMTIDKTGKHTIKRYWKPEEIKINYKITEQEAKERFLMLLDQAIFDRIDDLATTGFELSGGLDSSSIVSWVKHRKPQENVTAFSMYFTSMEACDESEYIDAMEEKYQLNLQKLATDQMDYKSRYSLENNYRLNPCWPIFITYTMGFSVVERAKELKIKTILTGQGGDHILAGNLYVLDEYFRTFQWLQLYKEVRALPNWKRFIKAYLVAPLIGEKNIQILRSFYHKIKRRKSLKKIPEIDFKELSDFYSGHSVSFKYDLEQVLHSTFSALMDSSYYTVAEEHFGIVFRHPFFDRRLIEFMLTLPPKFKYSEGLSKRLLRKAMEGVLPEKIRQRTDKAEFSEVLRQQIDAIDLDDLFHDANLARLGLVDQEKLDRYKEDYISGKMKSVVYFWQLINLEYWYRFNFVNGHNLDR